MSIAKTGREDRSLYLDWSVVSDVSVEKALKALVTVKRMADRWDGMAADELLVHRLVLIGFTKTGKPPSADDLRKSTGFTAEAMRWALLNLQRRDLIMLNDHEIAMAYPFSSGATRHQVSLGDQTFAAICAIDALGTAAMTGSATVVRSDCSVCEELIEIGINEDGLTVETVHPAATVIWAGVTDVDGSAASTQCQSMLAFCSDKHLDAWIAKGTPGTGFRFTPTQATQAGAAIFRPFLLLSTRSIELESTT